MHCPIAPISAASDTTSSQFIVLVPGLQEPSAADLLSELISAHIEFLCLAWSKCLIRCDKRHSWVATDTSCFDSPECCGGVLRHLPEPRKIYSCFKLKPCQEGQRSTGSLPSMVGRGTWHSTLDNILTRDQINHLLVIPFFVSLCALFLLFV